MDRYVIAAAVPLVAQAVFFLRWLHRRALADEIQRAFVRDMALNHLPHIYRVLHQIGRGCGVQLDEPPPVCFCELNHRRRP